MKNKKNILIGGLLALVLVMAVGYAAFATNLNINGTSTIDSKWDVHIKDNGVTVNTSSYATNRGASKVSDLTAQFECELTDPGKSTISYDIIVENTGTFDAKLSSINLTGTTTYVDATTSGIAVDDVITKNGGTDTLTVTVSYKNVSVPPTLSSDRTAHITVTLNYVQSDSAPAPSPSPSPEPTGLIIDPTFVPQYYAYHTSKVMRGGGYDISSWTNDPNTLAEDHNYYLGHDVEITSGTIGTVTANYVCFIINNTQYCMKGKDTYSDTVYFTENKALLGALKEPPVSAITCSTFSVSEAWCSGDDVGFLSANSSGNAWAGVSSYVYCAAGSSDGSSRCIE